MNKKEKKWTFTLDDDVDSEWTKVLSQMQTSKPIYKLK